MRRMIALWAAAISIFAVFAGCSKATGSLPIRYDIASLPKTLDPQFCQSPEEHLLIANLFENLTGLSKNGDAVPAAAESWKTSPNGLTYTFALRKNLIWSDGTPLTSANFVFAFRRLFDSGAPSPSAKSFLMLKNADKVLAGILPSSSLGVFAPDGDTVRFVLDHTYPSFPELLALSAAAPCNETFFRDQKGRYGLSPEHIIGNGPFKLTNQTESVITLRKNETHRSPPLSDLVYVYINRGDAVSLFMENRSDLCMIPFQRQTSSLLEGETFYNASWLLLFSPSGLFKEECDLRAAFVGALGDEPFNRLPPDIPPAQGLIPPDSRILGEEYRALAGPLSPPPLVQNPRKLFFDALSSQNRTQLPKLTLLVSDDSLDTELGGVAQRLWQEKLSVYVNLEPLSLANLTARIASDRFDLAIAPLPSAGTNPADMLSFFSSSLLDDCSLSNDSSLPKEPGDAASPELPELRSLLDSARLMHDAKAAAAACLAAEQMIADSFFAAPIYDAPSVFMRREGVSGGEYLPATQVVLFSSVVRIS